MLCRNSRLNRPIRVKKKPRMSVWLERVLDGLEMQWMRLWMKVERLPERRADRQHWQKEQNQLCVLRPLPEVSRPSAVKQTALYDENLATAAESLSAPHHHDRGLFCSVRHGGRPQTNHYHSSCPNVNSCALISRFARLRIICAFISCTYYNVQSLLGWDLCSKNTETLCF